MALKLTLVERSGNVEYIRFTVIKTNMWPNDVLAFNHPLCVQIVCLGFVWILRNMLIAKVFF